MSKEYKLCACPLDCLDVCSMRAEIIDGKITKLEGNKEHPVTQGFICEKGRKHIERMYSPLRIKRPMKKVDGKFIEITWDEALDIISRKLKYYIEQYGSLSIAQYNDGGAGGLLKNIENLFFDYLGSVTLFKGSLCWGAGIAAQRKDFGDVKGHGPEDIINARTIIIWGRNPAETNMHLMPFIKKARDNGAQIVLIDPIKTATAAYSDWHIKLKPNGDAAFTLAVSKYMIENQLYDKAFVTSSSKGFEEIKNYINGLEFSELLDLSGTSQETVIQFVKQLLNKPTTIYIGYGIQRYNYGGITVRAIDMLGALAGIIGMQGGGVNYANRVYSDHINWKSVKPRHEVKHRYIAKAKLPVELNMLENPKVKAIFISRSNPAVQLPDSNGAIEAIKHTEFKVVLDYFMTDTAQLADIVLPITYFVEERDIIYSSMWHGYINFNDKLVDRYYDAKPEFEIYSLLAQRLGLVDFPQMNEEQWLNKLLSSTTDIGVNLEELKTRFYTIAKNVSPIAWADCKFKTQSGRFEFADAADFRQYINDSTLQKKDFRLLTVHMRDSLHSQHTMTAEIEMPEVYISAEDASSLNINNRDKVMLQNQYGNIKAIVRISENTQKGVLYMKEGWWFKNGGSVNCLTPHGLSDIGNQATYNECLCQIIKIGVCNE